MDTINAAVGVVICDDMCGAYAASLCSLMLLVMLLMFAVVAAAAAVVDFFVAFVCM